MPFHEPRHLLFPQAALLSGRRPAIYLLCVWTQSRVAWVAIPVTLVFITWWKSRKLALLAIAALIIAMTTFYFTDAGFRGRFDRTVFEKNDAYNLGPRKRLWAAQLYFFHEHPLLGVGWNNKERRAGKGGGGPPVPRRQGTVLYGHAHSTFLQMLSTTGLLGLTAYLWLWGAVFLSCIRVIRNRPRDSLDHWLGVGLFAGFIGFQIQGLTQWNFGDAEVIHNMIFFWAVITASESNSPANSPA